MNELFDDAVIETFRELGIDPNDAVFVKKGFFGKSESYVCRLNYYGGVYSFTLPEKSPRSFKKRLAALNRRVLAVNNAFIRKAMAEAKKNAAFVERFNNELFYKFVYYKDLKLSVKELFKFYETDPYYKKINIAADKDKAPFIAMYAIAFCGCTLTDIFTIDGIFSLQPQRFSDNAKKQAGNGAFYLLFRDDKEEIDLALEKIGESLIGIIPPRTDLDNPDLLAKNYTLYSALSEIGRVFSEIFLYNGNRNLDDALKAADELKKFAKAAALCEKMAVLRDNEDYRETEEYKRLKNENFSAC